MENIYRQYTILSYILSFRFVIVPCFINQSLKVDYPLFLLFAQQHLEHHAAQSPARAAQLLTYCGDAAHTAPPKTTAKYNLPSTECNYTSKNYIVPKNTWEKSLNRIAHLLHCWHLGPGKSLIHGPTCAPEGGSQNP